MIYTLRMRRLRQLGNRMVRRLLITGHPILAIKTYFNVSKDIRVVRAQTIKNIEAENAEMPNMVLVER